jgi:hypothetical protein
MAQQSALTSIMARKPPSSIASTQIHPLFGNTLNFATSVDLASIMSIYNYSTVNPDSKLVYLYGKFELSRITQNQVVLVRAPEELLDDYHFTITTFVTAQVQVECQFHHPTYPVVTNQARYMWRMLTSSGVVCDLPKLQDSPETYTPRLVLTTRCITPPRRCK